MSEELETLNCTFTTVASLYLAYMPFIKGGGLFIRTLQSPPLGKKFKLSVQLLDTPEHYNIEVKVIWITPKGAQGNKPAGIGLQCLGDDCRHLTNKIETYLAGMLKSTADTDTV